MPRLDGTHVASRLRERLEELREGKEVAPRDLRALLTEKQQAAMDAAWAEQQALRKKKRARTKEEETALGWRTKRDIHIEAYEAAIAEADDGMVETLEELQRKANVRQARIYMDKHVKALEEGKTPDVAANLANNELTRNGLNRLDGKAAWHHSKRDEEVWEMERQIKERVKANLPPEELEQIELMKQHEKTLREANKKHRG
jgi:hypothetical protein